LEKLFDFRLEATGFLICTHILPTYVKLIKNIMDISAEGKISRAIKKKSAVENDAIFNKYPNPNRDLLF